MLLGFTAFFPTYGLRDRTSLIPRAACVRLRFANRTYGPVFSKIHVTVALVDLLASVVKSEKTCQQLLPQPPNCSPLVLGSILRGL